MGYIDTLHVKLSPDGFYKVHGGFVEAEIGEKNNYFRYYPSDCSSREAKAITMLGINVFPSGANKHETKEQADAWLAKYAAHAKKVIEMPASFKVGHSCEHWK